VRRTVPLSLLLLALSAVPVRAQSLDQQLSVLTDANARLFVGPLARGIGHALTAGIVSTADPHGMLGFELGIQAAGAQFADADKTFQVVLPTSVTYAGRTYQNPYEATNGGASPTVAGSGTGVVLKPRVGSSYYNDLLLAGKNPNSKEFQLQFPEGLDFPVAPFAVLEGSLGIGFGTQITARVIPTIDLGKAVGVDEIGDVSAFGFAVMHNLTQWLPIPTPFWDVSVVFGQQKLELGNYANAKGNTLGLVASAGLGPLSVYGNASTYKSDIDVDYTVSNPNNNPALPANGTQILFRETVSRTKRLALGAQLDLVVMKFAAEYGMGDYKTFAGKVAFGLR
jgi:hypothetical protein